MRYLKIIGDYKRDDRVREFSYKDLLVIKWKNSCYLEDIEPYTFEKGKRTCEDLEKFINNKLLGCGKPNYL